MPVTSSICFPSPNSDLKAGDNVEIRGYAWSGGGSRIIRVDVTFDEGKTWTEAEIMHQDHTAEPRHYGWTLWRIPSMQVPRGKQMKVWTKAVDSSYNVQPESFEHIWNLRGVLSNAYSKVTYNIVK